MGRKKDDRVWEEFEKTNDGITECKHCRAEFRGKPSATRLRSHLLGIEGKGIKICTLVPDDVKNALADASTSRKRPRIEPPSSINNDSDNQGQGDNGQQMHEECQHVEDILEKSFTSADYRCVDPRALRGAMAVLQECIVVNSSASTSAPLQNNESENQMQVDQRGVQDIDQERSVMVSSSGFGTPIPTRKCVGAAFQRNMHTVLEWLKSDEVSSIGIYGMGGVGKTELLKHIHNKILEDKRRFGNVYWIDVSQDFSVGRLQNLIAERIGLGFQGEEDLKMKAAKLSKELRIKCKFVLILDDLWNHFDVKMIGIPIEVNGCKLIVATRCLEVCRRINCNKELLVELLLKNEAWEFFLETLGHDLAPEVEQIARSIAGECAGLPLGIFTMAGSMRQKDNIHVWQNVLTELQKSKVRPDDMEVEVFKILRYSYTRLNETELKECLLYCALYPEDFTIDKNELIEELIDEGIIEKMDTRQEAFNKGFAMLNTLENSCLLDCRHDRNGVKMHDLIRDMAIQIMKECSLSLAGKQLTCLPEKKWWTENLVRVSLMNNDIREISSHYSPRCPDLSTLILSNNRSLQSIAEPFFYQLLGLKVLNISYTEIEKLPESVGDLEKLTALILRYCKCLTHLPSLRKLEALEKLDLHGCRLFEKVPEGLESLFNLNYLDLLFTGVKDLPPGILTNLSHLQYLGFYESPLLEVKVKGEEVGRLSNLDFLFWRFNDQEDFNNYMHSLSNMHTAKQQLSQFTLVVGPRRYGFEEMFFVNCGQYEAYFTGCNMSREVLLPKDVQILHIFNVTIHNGSSLCLKNAIHLKEFIINGCKEMEYLFCLSCLPSIILNLENLRACNMEKLRGLFSKDEDDGVVPPTPMPIQLLPTATFSCLRKFTIAHCHSMKQLFPFAMLSNLQNLQLLHLCDCSEMEEIIVAEEEEGSNSQTHNPFTLPNLTEFYLIGLPKLKSICNAKLKCDSLKFVGIGEVPELKKIPVCLDNTIISSLEEIKIHSKEWWALVEWGDPINKAALQRIVHYDNK